MPICEGLPTPTPLSPEPAPQPQLPNPRCLARRRELGTGRTNHNFIATSVADASKRYFVRVGSDLPVYGVTRAREQAAARAAADASIAPAVLYTASDAMVTGFVEGRTLTEKELKDACAGTGDPSLLAEVAATLRTMHALPAPPSPPSLVLLHLAQRRRPRQRSRQIQSP